MKKLFLSLSLFIGLTNTTNAQTELVQDCNPGTDGSYPYGFVRVGNDVYFSASKAGFGVELWKTDGTDLGTGMVKDINTANFGAGSSYPDAGIALGSDYIFVCGDTIVGTELWITDGTEAGTVNIIDIQPGAYGSYPEHLTEMGGYIYFSADDGLTNGRELWRTDGTAGGTTLVKNIYPGFTGSGITEMVALGNMIYFTANDGNHGYELWKSDGTGANTEMVTDIWSGPPGSFPQQLYVMGNEIFFTCNDGSLGDELWKSDGTTTTNVEDIMFGAGGSNIMNGMIEFNNKLFFYADNFASGGELWTTDGTNTSMLLDINPSLNGSNVMYFTVYNNKLFFTADNGTDGVELWETDGTVVGTKINHDINPYGSSSPSYLTVFNNKLFFRADNGSNGQELYSTDGTLSSSVMHEIYSGSTGAYPSEMTALGNQLLFSAQYDDLGTYNMSEVWKYTAPIVLVNSITVQGQGGVNTITTDNGILQMEATVLPANATDGTYTWSVTNGTGSALIDANGVLTAQTNGNVTVTVTANDASGLSANTVITISNQTNVGVEENNVSGISMYPNPTNGVVNFSSANIRSIVIYTIEGQIVMEENNIDSINISHLSKGIYFVKIATIDGTTVTKKLIKK